MELYLYISCLALAFFPVVSQGGKCHILNQLLESLIAGNKICLTVNLHHTDTKIEKDIAVHNHVQQTDN